MYEALLPGANFLLMSCTIARVLETLIKTNSYLKQDGKWAPSFAPNLHSDSLQADAEMDIALFSIR